jgi:sigma factor-binding protein Crl
MKAFVGLGPYIRESQCKGNCYFFDCLAVCVNSKPAPDKREFWGWWMDIEADEAGFTYQTQIGMYNKAGDWQVKAIKQAEIKQEIDTNLTEFLQKMEKYLATIELTFRPADAVSTK